MAKIKKLKVGADELNLDDYQGKLTAGTNIQISANNTISATDTTYSAGSGLNLTGTKFSVDNSTVALKSDLSTVATSGSYSDLLDKPTIPTVNNATLTIQRNNTAIGTFTANASSNKTINIVVPTSTSDLTNDSGFIGGVSTITNARIDEIMGVA